jgi:hypothetical protein
VALGAVLAWSRRGRTASSSEKALRGEASCSTAEGESHASAFSRTGNGPGTLNGEECGGGRRGRAGEQLSLNKADLCAREWCCNGEERRRASASVDALQTDKLSDCERSTPTKAATRGPKPY